MGTYKRLPLEIIRGKEFYDIKEYQQALIHFNKALEWIKSYNKIDPFVTDQEVSHDTDNPLLNALY